MHTALINFNLPDQLDWHGASLEIIMLCLVCLTCYHAFSSVNSWMSYHVMLLIWFEQVFGLMTKPLIRLLLPSPKHLVRMASSEPATPKSFIVPLLGNGQAVESNQNIIRPSSLRMLLTTPTNSVHYYWRKFDDAFMRPVFGGRGFVPFVPRSPTDRSNHQWQ